MSWTYSQDPADSNLDEVRFLAGQTSSGDEVLVQDEEISYAIGDANNNKMAAARVLRSMANRYTILATDTKVGELSIKYGERGKALALQASEMERSAALRTAMPYASGISQADMDVADNDTDAVDASFGVGQLDFDSSLGGSSS